MTKKSFSIKEGDKVRFRKWEDIISDGSVTLTAFGIYTFRDCDFCLTDEMLDAIRRETKAITVRGIGTSESAKNVCFLDGYPWAWSKAIFIPCPPQPPLDKCPKCGDEMVEEGLSIPFCPNGCRLPKDFVSRLI